MRDWVGILAGNPKRGRNRKNKDQVGRTSRRKQLSDITNTVDSVRRGRFDGGGEENAKALSCSSSNDHVAHLLKVIGLNLFAWRASSFSLCLIL